MANRDHTDHGEAVLAWREAGSGPPVVFLHGLGGSRVSWGPQLRGLADRFRCIAWDMPGYGDSAPLLPLTFAGIAERLVDLLDRLEVDRVDLVGLSFGGMHALHTALAFPDRVNRMVLADTSPAFGLDGTTAADWRSSRLAPLEAGTSLGAMAETIIDAITAVPLEGRIRQETVEGFGRIPNPGFRASVECLPTHDVRSELNSIDHQSLVIVGELDEETPPSYAKALADGLPNGVLETIDGVGHLTPAEAPDRFNQLVGSFLAVDQGAA